MKCKIWKEMLLHMNSEVCVWVSSSIKLKQNQDLTVTIITTVFTKKKQN